MNKLITFMVAQGFLIGFEVGIIVGLFAEFVLSEYLERKARDEMIARIARNKK